MSSDLQYWLAFSHIKKLGPKRFRLLSEKFPSMEAAWHAGLPELTRAGLEDALAEEITVRRSTINPEKMIEQLVQNRVQAVTINDEQYPRLLRHITDPPPLLYFRGTLQDDKTLLAVVGTRKISTYGQQVTEHIVRRVTQAGVVIVSGLALGIDAAAHTTCVEHNGRTIAVLGSGLDKQNMYPSHNRYLADNIVAHGGCIFSEHPIGTAPLKHHFPQRNRVIAGLAQATLVIEAAEISGALITSKYALDYNRDVAAVPGNIFTPNSKGCNKLIKQGAFPVTNADDVFTLLDLESPQPDQEEIKNLSADEQVLFDLLTHEPQSFDALLQKTNLSTNVLNAVLTELELKKLIAKHQPNLYART